MMKRNSLQLAKALGIKASISLLCLLVLFGTSCAQKKEFFRPSESQLSAYSGGLLSRSSDVRVVFAKDVALNADFSKGAVPAQDGLITFEPSVKGAAVWEDASTLVFKPQTGLPVGGLVKATVDMGLADGKRGGEKWVNFEFGVKEPFVDVVFDTPKVSSDGSYSVSGTIVTTDKEKSENIEKMLSANLGSKAIKASWSHSDTSHSFVLSEIEKPLKAQNLVVSWKGEPIGSKAKGVKEIQVPSKSDFKMISVKTIAEDSSAIEIAFSDLVKKDQDLRGLINVSGVDNPRFQIDGNRVLVYSAEGFQNLVKLTIEENVKNSSGDSLKKTVAATVEVKYELPKVRFLGTGVIVPTSRGYTVPIETMNLNAVYVEALKIYGTNITQFLQVNNLEGTNELNRVGEVVWSKTIPLGYKAEWKNTWVRTGLDLSELIKKHPDGMFQIRITFAKDNTEYVCANAHPSFAEMDFPPAKIEDSVNSEDDEYSYWNYYDMDWQVREQYYQYKNDPCHPAYYLSSFNRTSVVRRNVLVSNIGLQIKKEATGVTHVYAANLVTTDPIKGAKIQLINFQRQTLFSGLTNEKGMITLPSTSNAFLVIGEFLGQAAYVKLDEGSALKVGQFDISGDAPDKGVKGLIYTERGVWRPGDPIYLTFLLNDPNKTLPTNYPVLFELEDPRGQIVARATYTQSVNGFYAMPTKTDADSLTGDYIARVKVGNRIYTKNLKVETVMPNRLKMTLDFGGKTYLTDDDIPVTLEAKWLHGAVAPGLKADVSATFVKTQTTFTGFSDYTFEDPVRTVSSDRQMLFEGNLDNASKALFTIQLNPGDTLPGKLKANLLTRVFENSGVFSSEQVQSDFYPYSEYVGLKLPAGDASRGMLLTDIDHNAEVVVLDREGKAVANTEVSAEIFQIRWRWWWEKGDESLAEYAESESYNLISSGTVTTNSSGKATWKFQVKYPSWGRYMVRVTDTESGHAAAKIVYIDWPGWAGRAQSEQGGGANMLSLSTEKTNYSVGETIKVSFPSSQGYTAAASSVIKARALLVLEKGGSIIREEWLETKDGSTSFSFAATADMAPNVYAHITFIQPHAQTANDLPIRLYGIIPILVENPETHLSPIITGLPAEIKPASNVSFKVTEQNGKPMTYTVAVVDEGLLGLTRFKAQDPWGTFYKKEASYLKNWDMYQFVSGAYSGKLETLLAIGGSDEGFGNAGKKPNRFPPVVKYIGPFSLGKGESKEHVVNMGEYVGAVRFMLVAGAMNGQNSASQSTGAFGTFEKEVPVRTDVMVFATAPRMVAPNEEFTLPVTVFSYLPGNQALTVQVSAEGALGKVTASANEGVLKTSGVGETMVYTKLKSLKSIGSGKITVTVIDASNQIKAKQVIDMQVRTVGVPEVAVAGPKSDTISVGSEWNTQITMPGIAGTNTLKLEVSKMMPIDLSSRLDYLIQYPHGCVEQTTSSVFPQLYLDKIMNLEPKKVSEIQKNVQAGIERLKSFQTSSGGFSYWPGEGYTSDWGTNYAGHFLLEAKKAGYAVSDSMLDPFLKYQAKVANNWSNSQSADSDLLIQSYRLYTLAYAGKSELGAMNRLKEKGKLPVSAQWRLAACYYLAGRKDVAQEMVKNIDVRVARYRELSNSYGSDTRDRAMILEALVIMNDSVRSLPLAKQLVSELTNNNWYSTQELAYTLIALIPYSSKTNEDICKISYSFKGKDGLVVSPTTVSFNKTMATFEIPVGSETSGTIVMRNDSGIPLFPRVIMKGIPEPGNEVELEDTISASVEYYNISGDSVSPTEVPLGDDMDIEITVKSKTSDILQELALEHLIPSGWEIVNTRVGQEAGEYTADGESSSDEEYSDNDYYWGTSKNKQKFIRYQDIRDDRVYTYFDLKSYQSKTFKIRVNKTYEGRFYLPAIRVYAMYDESIQAVIKGEVFTQSKVILSPGVRPLRANDSTKPLY